MSHGAKKDCKSATTRSTITTGLRPANFPSLGKGTKATKSQYEKENAQRMGRVKADGVVRGPISVEKVR